MNIRIEQATVEHIGLIADYCREADKQELWATAYVSPADAMSLGIKASGEMAFTGFINDIPVCMFGFVRRGLISSVGVPWMVSTSWLDQKDYAAAFLKPCKPVIRIALDTFPILENFVDARNKRAIRWLQWLGFTLFDPQPFGVLGLPFHRFRQEV